MLRRDFFPGNVNNGEVADAVGMVLAHGGLGVDAAVQSEMSALRFVMWPVFDCRG